MGTFLTSLDIGPTSEGQTANSVINSRAIPTGWGFLFMKGADHEAGIAATFMVPESGASPTQFQH
jgi:hypothetical protein